MNHHHDHDSGPGRTIARLGPLARGMLALAALGVLLVGVPLALARTAGWPVPSGWPTTAGMRLTARGGLSDAFWLKAFAAVVWLAWVQLSFAVVTEAVALVRGRAPRPRLGLSWAQDLAAHLVGAVVMVTSVVGQAPHAGAAPPPVAVQTAAIASAPAAVLMAEPPAAHVVVRGESLSSIAEDELGTQAAWPQIWEANRGRSYGTRIFEDPNLILPGWDLAVPGAPTPPPAVAPPPVEPVLIPPLILRASESPAPVTTTNETASTATNVVAAPAARDEAPSTSVPAHLGAARVPEVATAPQDVAPAWARLATLLGATLLATGTAGLAASSRRRALRGATVTSAVVPPEPALADAVTVLAAGSDHLAMARLELALRAMAGHLDRIGSDARPVAVRRRGEALDVALDRAADIGGPWEGSAESSTWSLPSTVALTELTGDARAVAPPCPALVGVGRDNQGAEVYLDLEAVGTLSIASGPSAASSLRLLAATLAVTPLADGLRVLVVGPDLPQLRGRHDVRTVADVAAAVAEVEAQTASIAQVTAGARSTFRLRAMAGHESWEPVVVILTDPLVGDADLGRLSRLAGDHRGVAVVGIDLGDAACQLAVDADGIAYLGPGVWPVRPYGLTEEDLASLGAALAAADGLVIEAGSIDTAVDLDASSSIASPKDTDPSPWSLMVRVLGPIDVVDPYGRPATFERAKALELVVWLAQHAASATRAGARAALWEMDVSNASFSNIVSEARRSLARLAPPPEGEEWLARTYVERLPLNPAVVLDADLVQDHLSKARRLPDAEAIVELRQALSFVRGAPYADRSYLWPDAEALPSTLTLLVTTVAAELGLRLLALDDMEGVFEATAVGLDVLPGHEELIALRLRAHALKGDRAALRNEYASYEHAVLADPWDGEPAPQLVALRRELLGAELPVPVAGD